MKDGVLTMVMLASVLCHVPAAAQTAATRDREPVVFISRAGMAGEVRGDLIALDDTTVTLRVDGRQLSLPLARVTRIQREGDNLRNGALIGGIVLGLCCAIVCGQGLDDAGQLPMAVAVNGALGALVGAGIDAAQKGRTTIYPAVRGRGATRPDPALGLRSRFVSNGVVPSRLRDHGAFRNGITGPFWRMGSRGITEDHGPFPDPLHCDQCVWHAGERTST